MVFLSEPEKKKKNLDTYAITDGGCQGTSSACAETEPMKAKGSKLVSESAVTVTGTGMTKKATVHLWHENGLHVIEQVPLSPAAEQQPEALCLREGSDWHEGAV